MRRNRPEKEVWSDTSFLNLPVSCFVGTHFLNQPFFSRLAKCAKDCCPMLSDLFRKAFDGDGVVFGNQAEDGFFRFTQLYSSVFPFVFEPAPVERNSHGYRVHPEIVGFLAAFPDGLGNAVPRLLDDVAQEEDLHKLLYLFFRDSFETYLLMSDVLFSLPWTPILFSI